MELQCILFDKDINLYIYRYLQMYLYGLDSENISLGNLLPMFQYLRFSELAVYAALYCIIMYLLYLIVIVLLYWCNYMTNLAINISYIRMFAYLPSYLWEISKKCYMKCQHYLKVMKWHIFCKELHKSFEVKLYDEKILIHRWIFRLTLLFKCKLSLQYVEIFTYKITTICISISQHATLVRFLY